MLDGLREHGDVGLVIVGHRHTRYLSQAFQGHVAEQWQVQELRTKNVKILNYL